MNIDEMKLGDIKAIANMFNCSDGEGLNYHLGKKVIIRTYSAGVWFGKLAHVTGHHL